MTAVLVDVPLTRELLDSVPVGGRIVWRLPHVRAVVLHKVTANGWVYGKNHPQTYMTGYEWSTTSVEAGYRGHLVTVHQQGVVRIQQLVDDTLGRHWGWSCAVCGDGLDYLTLPAAGDWARAHIKNHAEIARAL